MDNTIPVGDEKEPAVTCRDCFWFKPSSMGNGIIGSCGAPVPAILDDSVAHWMRDHDIMLARSCDCFLDKDNEVDPAIQAIGHGKQGDVGTGLLVDPPFTIILWTTEDIERVWIDEYDGDGMTADRIAELANHFTNKYDASDINNVIFDLIGELRKREGLTDE